MNVAFASLARPDLLSPRLTARGERFGSNCDPLPLSGARGITMTPSPSWEGEGRGEGGLRFEHNPD